VPIAVMSKREQRKDGEATFRPAHPATRIGDTYFIGSLFWLEAGTKYIVGFAVEFGRVDCR